MEKTTLAELVSVVDCIEVDGKKADKLEPSYVTADEIAERVGISVDSPRYSGMHQHCQYQRTG